MITSELARRNWPNPQPRIGAHNDTSILLSRNGAAKYVLSPQGTRIVDSLCGEVSRVLELEQQCPTGPSSVAKQAKCYVAKGASSAKLALWPFGRLPCEMHHGSD